jgi:hypothetical protein
LAIGIAWVFANKFVHSKDHVLGHPFHHFLSFLCAFDQLLFPVSSLPLDASKVMTFKNHVASLATGNEMLSMHGLSKSLFTSR